VTISVAYLARGKLHVRSGGSRAFTIESQFGQQLRDRAVRLQRKNAWKTTGRGSQFAGALLAGAAARDPAAMRIAMTAVARGPSSGELLYVLDTNEVGGVFAVPAGGGEERRLFHGSEQRVKHLCVGQEAIACSVVGAAGAANLGVMRLDGSDLVELTEGDSVDLAPTWRPDAERRLVYQSAGVARNSRGFPVGVGPFGIHELDIDSGRITTIAEEPTRDFLGPKIARDGTLYCLRRPYREPGHRASWRIALDIALIPFRVMWALFQFLNFFSAKYTGKTLTAGGPQKEAADLRHMIIWGNLVDAEKAARAEARDGEAAPALVPTSWELVRHRDGAAPEVLARAVLSFDLCEDDTLIYSDGSSVFHRTIDGKSQRLFGDAAIEQVVFLPRSSDR
jgi:hypothetical protein